MDFKNFLDKAKDAASQAKDYAIDTGKKVKRASNDAVNYGAKQLADSRMTLKTKLELENFISTSQVTHYTNPKSGEQKTFTHKIIIIWADPKSEFFQSLLYKFPVLSAKAYSQNISLKLADAAMQGVTLEDYGVKGLPCLQVYESEACIKTLEGEEKIQNLVKSLSLDINTSIDEL